MDPSEDLALHNLRGFFRLLFGITGFFAFVALVNVGDWWTGFLRLGAVGRLAVCFAVAVAGVAGRVCGPRLVARLPAPAVLVARDMLSLRRHGGLTPRSTRAAKIWFGVGVVTLLGASSLVLDPVEPGDRGSGLLMGAFGLAACVISGTRFVGQLRSVHLPRLVADVRAFRLPWPRRFTHPSSPESRRPRGPLWGTWLALLVSAFLLLGSLILAISPEEAGDRSSGLTMGPVLLIAVSLLVRRLLRRRRSRFVTPAP